MSNLGSRIRAHRERLGMTQADLAQAIECGKAQMSRIESGERNLRSSDLQKLAARLGVDVRELLGVRPRADLLAVAYRRSEGCDDEGREALAAVKRVLEVANAVVELGISGPGRAAAAPSITTEASSADAQGRAAAAQVRDHLALGAAPVHDLVDVAEELGAAALHTPLPEGISGLCVMSATKSMIAVNSTMTVGHQRFTLAHEIAHHLLDAEHGVTLDRADHLRGDGGDMERRAHAFAADLLMPAEGIRVHLAERPVDAAAFADLLFTFGVSASALSIRLRALGLISKSREREFMTERYYPKQLALEFGYLHQWRHERDRVGETEPPRELWRRALEAYQAGRLGVGLLAVLTGGDPEELEQELAEAGVQPDFGDLYPQPSTT